MARWLGVGTQQPRVGFEPTTSQSQVRHRTTSRLCYLHTADLHRRLYLWLFFDKAHSGQNTIALLCVRTQTKSQCVNTLTLYLFWSSSATVFLMMRRKCGWKRNRPPSIPTVTFGLSMRRTSVAITACNLNKIHNVVIHKLTLFFYTPWPQCIYAGLELA